MNRALGAFLKKRNYVAPWALGLKDWGRRGRYIYELRRKVQIIPLGNVRLRMKRVGFAKFRTLLKLD